MGLFPTSRPAWRWILDWILDNDLHILNDGSANQAIQITRNGSTTEIFLCGSNWSVKTSWRLAEPIGSSDHHPIIIELNHKICYKPVIPRSASWCRNGIDCSSFTNEVESKMSNLPHEPNSSLRVSCFNCILMSAATTHVGKAKSSKRSKPWMTPHVWAKIRIWNRLHQMIHQNCQEWRDACCEANEAINKAKTESWKNLLQDAMSIMTVQTCGKLFKISTVLLMLILLMLCPTMVELSLILNQKLKSSLTTMPGSANSICQNPTMTSTDSSRSILTHHLLTMRAVLHFLWVNRNLPSKRWKAKEQLALTIFHLRFSSHSILWPSRNYYPYSTHHSHLLTAHESGRLPPSFHCSKLGNLHVKSPLSVPSVSRHVSPNFWNVFLLIISAILPKPTTCSVNSKPVSKKDGAVKIRLLKQSKQSNMASNNTQWNALYWHSLTSVKHIYSLERKTTAPYAKHWDSSNIYLLDSIFPQRPLGACSTLQCL